MKICIPVTEDLGLQSPLCNHFGSTPLFILVDTDSESLRTISNQNQDHAHGACQPLLAFANENVDGVVVGGIGMGALSKLQAANIEVFISSHPTVEKTITALKAGTLQKASPAIACGYHGHGHHGHTGQGSHGPCGK